MTTFKLFLAVAMMTVAFTAGAAQILVVDREVDLDDSDGLCSITEAIVNANDDAATYGDCTAGSGADVIVLEQGSRYKFKVPLSTTSGANALPDVSTDITIRGQLAILERDSDRCVLDQITAPGEMRFFYVTPTGRLTLEDMTLLYGCADAPSIGAGNNGGSILSGLGLILRNVTIAESTARFSGGAIVTGYNHGGAERTVIEASHFLLNSAGSNGGAVYASNGGAGIVDSVFESNTAGNKGGALACGEGCEVRATLFSQNTAAKGGGFSAGYPVIVENATFIENSATGTGGGAIFCTSFCEATIGFSTLVDNTGIGGGLFLDYNTTAVVRSSIFKASTCGFDLGASISAPVLSFETTGTSCFTGGGAGFANTTAAALDLGGLTFDFGMTQVIPISSASAAYDAADDCIGVAGVLADDQRGVLRPVGVACDIGAYERQDSDLIFASGFDTGHLAMWSSVVE